MDVDLDDSHRIDIQSLEVEQVVNAVVAESNDKSMVVLVEHVAVSAFNRDVLLSVEQTR
eukprot:CAMPEP_0116895884 /NCGR_PEP_ID=MMETSP0467-20121206/5279_1 /TAXON_ID=283647 /ORGANISM="Mesodinium pulex, Strain SPMC105" /LENGTH=58 /DNA_ID=CAMNT_0004566803 /DNA_START=372 /DNA_END=548 /DNA_ORIENTATION=-